MSVTSWIKVNKATSVTVFAQFTKPTRSTWPTVKQVPATPTTVEYVWRNDTGTVTTWTYGTGTHITKLTTVAVGLYVATIPTTTARALITGKVVGSGAVKATAQFTIKLTQLAI